MRRNILENNQDEEEGINLTPMLDVVFIMLIFFIVTASFVKEAGIDVLTRPDAKTAVNKKKANILVAISARQRNLDRSAQGRQDRRSARMIETPACGKPGGVRADPGRSGMRTAKR